jgi:hypothetical protein
MWWVSKPGKMTESLRIRWRLWVAAVILVAAGTIGFHLSVTPIAATLYLQPKETVELSAFRLFPDFLRLAIRFDRVSGQERPELGSSRSKESDGYREFLNPGVPIKLLIEVEGDRIVFEALPANTYGETIGRQLVPFVDDGSPDRFQWPSTKRNLPAGFSKLNVTVLDVGQQLAGEKVTLVLRAPISLKTVAPHFGYGLLSWFLYWPLYTILLAGYGAVLILQTRRQRLNVLAEMDAHPKTDEISPLR